MSAAVKYPHVMKKSGKCSKCGSDKVIHVENGSLSSRQFGEAGIFFAVGITKFVCTECGYLEEWIDPPIQLKQLAQKRQEL